MKERLKNIVDFIKAVFILLAISILVISCANAGEKREEKIRQESYDDGYRDGYREAESEIKNED